MTKKHHLKFTKIDENSPCEQQSNCLPLILKIKLEIDQRIKVHYPNNKMHRNMRKEITFQLR